MKKAKTFSFLSVNMVLAFPLIDKSSCQNPTIFLNFSNLNLPTTFGAMIEHAQKKIALESPAIMILEKEGIELGEVG